MIQRGFRIRRGHRPIGGMHEVADVVAFARLDSELDFECARITNAGGCAASLEERYFQTRRITPLESQCRDGITKSGSFDELQGFQIDVELHDSSFVSTASSFVIIGQPMSLEKQAAAGCWWIKRDRCRLVLLVVGSHGDLHPIG